MPLLLLASCYYPVTQTLQTTLGPSKPKKLRPQTPPYEGPTPLHEGPYERLGSSDALVTSSDALVASSDALVTASFLLVVMPLLLVGMPLLLDHNSSSSSCQFRYHFSAVEVAEMHPSRVH